MGTRESSTERVNNKGKYSLMVSFEGDHGALAVSAGDLYPVELEYSRVRAEGERERSRLRNGKIPSWVRRL